mgnify:CR=1 FL=1
MALTVVKRPQGYILDTTANTGTVSSSSGALITKNTHGLSTGDFIYIYSALSSYNGYWYVSVVGANTFRIREYATASDQAFINSGSVTYYKSQLTHNWNCIHLPIIYKLKSDIWPTNGADTARTISTFSNYNGYTYIVASGDIKATGTASSLEQVILSGCTNAGVSIDGVYKILQWFSDTNFVINLAYSAANVLSSGTVQYYYYNYCARIKIYAGIPAAHTWTAQKPYVLMTEQRFIPDSSGIITLNISEFIKSKVSVISNNSIKDTLPNNIDAWCNFYITYAESYDDSNGYTVSEVISSYTDDSGTFEGYAVNSKLPFKTQSSGALSRYVSGVTSTTKQKWLTAFTNPVLFPGKYFDISYIKNTASAGDYVKREVYTTDGQTYTLREVFIDTQTDNDQGVYRYAISQSGWGEERIDITYYNSSNVALSETLTIYVDESCSSQDFYLTWLNYLGGYDYWNFSARKQYSINSLEGKTQESNIFATWPNGYGEFADSIVKQTVKRGVNIVGVSSQFLSTDQEDSIKLLFVSPLVQICTSQYDRRTVLVEEGTLPIRRDQDKTRKLSFNVTYTDELPSQSL